MASPLQAGKESENGLPEIRSVGSRDSSSKIAEISETFRIYEIIGSL
jgi:hypothetical protein